MESLLGVGSGSPVVGTNFTTAIIALTTDSPELNPEVKKAIRASGPILIDLAPTLGFDLPSGTPSLPVVAREPLVAKCVPNLCVFKCTSN